jgi:hypothetical protein
VPTKTSADLDRETPGVVQIDFVEHCGQSASGAYVNSLSVVDIYSGWWQVPSWRYNRARSRPCPANRHAGFSAAPSRWSGRSEEPR